MRIIPPERLNLPALPPYIDPMPPFETIYIDTMVAACDGGGGALGHPKVYLNLSAAGEVECPYCSRLFVNKTRRGNGAGAVTAGAAGHLEAGTKDHAPPSASPDTAGARSSSANPAKP
jgi:uncharacterized Zn-finger protein